MTERQSDTLALVVAGLTNAEIAQRLQVSEECVKDRVRRLKERFCARNRAHLVACAFREGAVT